MKKEKKMSTTIGYLRRSRITEGNNSIETQKKMIEDFCETNNFTLTQIVMDDGISGSGEKTNKRDGYNSVMKMVENGEVDNVVVISLSRWGRNLGEIYKSVELMNNTDTHFYSIKENIDTSSPYGRFTINLLSSLYEMELELIKERTRDTLKVKKQNNKVYSKLPYGFDRVGDDLIENPKEKKLMRKIVRLKKSGSSYGQITDYLNRNRYKTKSGTKWTRGNVFGVLKSRMNENQVCFS